MGPRESGSGHDPESLHLAPSVRRVEGASLLAAYPVRPFATSSTTS